MKKVLTVAGSDSGGCAGIQADIKAISACGAFAASAITAVTSQNTLGVDFVEELTPTSIKTQIEAVLSDIGADAVKSGMLFSKEIVCAVSEVFKKYSVKNYVLDPVMIASSGAKLLKESAVEALKENLIPLCSLITP
ncbi:MAG: bifunctional hydroxymethylpyrimidine kinase/phosphomethylpyrimidine kinase, partial [Deferribacterales bacterium]|nr:bifunctional hydroxymethylpyrimidine kinase/phosphomethylpyrimidine kinase [Deferribacterales bacterium]